MHAAPEDLLQVAPAAFPDFVAPEVGETQDDPHPDAVVELPNKLRAREKALAPVDARAITSTRAARSGQGRDDSTQGSARPQRSARLHPQRQWAEHRRSAWSSPDWREYFNNQCPHRSLGLLTPTQLPKNTTTQQRDDAQRAVTQARTAADQAKQSADAERRALKQRGNTSMALIRYALTCMSCARAVRYAKFTIICILALSFSSCRSDQLSNTSGYENVILRCVVTSSLRIDITPFDPTPALQAYVEICILDPAGAVISNSRLVLWWGQANQYPGPWGDSRWVDIGTQISVLAVRDVNVNIYFLRDKARVAQYAFPILYRSNDENAPTGRP